MTERFTFDEEGNILDDGEILTIEEVLEYLNWYRKDMLRFSVENEQLRNELNDCEKIRYAVFEQMGKIDK